MADRFDVAERLAEGRVAVEHTQTYVRACQTLGYQHPDLTSRPSEVRDWFDSEDGLDLRALDRDCAQLRAAGDAITEALRIQRAQLAELAAGWTGQGGEAAGRFLQRHCDAASLVATEVRAAAQRCESLRDNLWYLLDAKVATAIAIDDRKQLERAAWLTAATVVTTGTGERSTAEQVVGQQIMPYVDNDIREDWLSAMRSSRSGFATSYDMVIDRMAAAPAVSFESPGDLWPGFRPLQPAPPNTPPLTATSAPAVTLPTSLPAPAAPAPTPTIPAPALAPTPPLSDLGSALGDSSAIPTGAGGLGGLGGLGDMGTGSGGLGGLGGLASRIVDAMTGLLGSAADQLGDPSGLDGSEDPSADDASDEDPFHPADKHDDNKPDDDKHDDAGDKPEDAQQARPVDQPPPADVPTPVESPPAVAPTPPASPSSPAPAPASAPAPAGDGSTPCEIAAEQLPQAGQ